MHPDPSLPAVPHRRVPGRTAGQRRSGSRCWTAPRSPGASGEPMFLDVTSLLAEAVAGGLRDELPITIGGRYGLSSKEFTPAMVQAIYEELGLDSPRPRFTVGIHDDVTHLSLDYDPTLDLENPETLRAVFYGLGSDGTVGANKNTIKILGSSEDTFAQGYFVYDSKKSGSRTVSHLRFGPHPIHAPYLINQAGFIGCHHWSILERVDVLEFARPGTVLLLNAPYGAGGDLASAAPAGSAQDHRAGDQGLRHRRRQGRARRRAGQPHQHHPADLLLRHLRRPATRQGHREDQGRDHQDLRPQVRRRWCARTTRPSTRRWPSCTRWRCRTSPRRITGSSRRCPPTRPSSCARSPRPC